MHIILEKGWNVIQTLQISMSFLCNESNDSIFLYFSEMALDKRVLLSRYLIQVYLNVIKLKSYNLTLLVYYRYAFNEAHPASNVTWVTLEMPLTKFSFIIK